MTRKPVSGPAPRQMFSLVSLGSKLLIRVRRFCLGHAEQRHLWPDFRIAIWVGRLCHVGELCISCELREMSENCDLWGT
jgi:hypothetical protein